MCYEWRRSLDGNCIGSNPNTPTNSVKPLKNSRLIFLCEKVGDKYDSKGNRPLSNLNFTLVCKCNHYE